MTFKRGISISDDSERPLFADTFVLSVSELILWFNVYVVSALFAGPALEGLWVCGPLTDTVSALTRRQWLFDVVVTGFEPAGVVVLQHTTPLYLRQS